MEFYYWLTRSYSGYTFSNVLSQPLGAALVVGLAIGRLSEVMAVGAGVQLAYLGVTSTPGGSVPSSPALALAIVIPIASDVEINAETVVALAASFGVSGIFVDQLRRTVSATWVYMTDKYAEELNYGGVYRATFVYPALAGFLIRFLLVFVANFFGQSATNKVLEVTLAWLMRGFEVMDGILPALGFALTTMIIGKKNLISYFLTGFAVVVYFDAEIMAVAISGICIAFLIRNKALSEEVA